MNSQAYEACSKASQQEAGERQTETCEFLIENEAETLGRGCVNAKKRASLSRYEKGYDVQRAVSQQAQKKAALDSRLRGAVTVVALEPPS